MFAWARFRSPVQNESVDRLSNWWQDDTNDLEQGESGVGFPDLILPQEACDLEQSQRQNEGVAFPDLTPCSRRLSLLEQGVSGVAFPDLTFPQEACDLLELPSMEEAPSAPCYATERFDVASPVGKPRLVRTPSTCSPVSSAVSSKASKLSSRGSKDGVLVAKGASIERRATIGGVQGGAMIAKAANVVGKQLAARSGPRVLVLGGKTFETPETFTLVKAVSARFHQELSGKAVVLTGGMPGVQKAFSKGLGGTFPGLCHLLPEGRTSSGYGVGRDVQCNVDLEHLPAVAARLADVVLVFGGSAAVAREAGAAFARGAIVIPMRCASANGSAAFNLPDAALERPAHVAMKSEWDLLTGHPCKVEAVAVAVTAIVARIAGRLVASGRA